MKLRTRHPHDDSQELNLVLTERQFNAITNALRELSLLTERYYPLMQSHDKYAVKMALRELNKSRTWNLIEMTRQEMNP